MSDVLSVANAVIMLFMFVGVWWVLNFIDYEVDNHDDMKKTLADHHESGM